MKALHLKYLDALGGAESILAMLARASERGGEDAVECHFAINQEGVVTEYLRRASPRVTAIPFTPPGILKARAYIRRHGIDILHAHGARANLLAVFCSILTGTPVVTTEHNADEPWRAKAWMNALDRFAGRRNARRIVVSEAVRQTLLRHRILPDARIVTILNGVDTERFSPGDKSEARTSLGLPDGVRLVTSAGRLVEQKSYEFFVDAAAQVASQRDDVRFLLAGIGERREALEAQAAERGLGHRLRFLGRVEDIPNLLRASDIFCLSSRWEGLPMALLEAMATGLPCVATSVGGVPQLISDGENGRRVPPESPEALAAALLETLDAPDAAAAMGRRARELVVRDYSGDRMIARYGEVYREVLAEAGRPESSRSAPAP